MKKVLQIIMIFLVYILNAQEYKKNINPFNIYPDFQKFNFEKALEGYKNLPYDSTGYFKVLNDGTLFNYMNSYGDDDIYYKVIPPHSYCTYMYFFYPSGKLKSFGQFAGADSTTPKIGIWKTYDESGKLINEVDEDIKFKKFSFLDVLKFTESKGHINLKTGINRINKTRFSFSKDNFWYIYIQTKYVKDEEEIGISYKINARNGKLVKTEIIETCLLPLGLCEVVNSQKRKNPEKNHIYQP